MRDGDPNKQDEGKRKDLCRLIVALSDIGNAKRLSEFIVDNITMGNQLWEPLQDATIISYARPFTKNEPYGPLPKKWLKFQSDSMKRLHDELIELRHQTIAHSDAAVRHVYVYPPHTAPSLIPDNKTMFAIRTIKLPPERFIEIAELCQTVGKPIQDEVWSRLPNVPHELGIHDAPIDLLTGEREELDPDSDDSS